MELQRKPLGTKNYGHIPHLPGSRMGPADYKCNEGQNRISTEKVRDKHDNVIVQEKLDGSNVGIARIDGKIYSLTRAGYLADTSPFEQHWLFAKWVHKQEDRFLAVLKDGERLCGEWLAQAHGTRYNLPHEPFVAFDIMQGKQRATLAEVTERIKDYGFIQPRLLHSGNPFTIEQAIEAIQVSGHGAVDPVEGAIWRVERNTLISPGKSSERVWKVDFLVKYVRPNKLDGIYLPELTGKEAVWNWRE
ncbi:MAG: RNA ligase family protein [Calothrix sp. FI2-JRJ7]|nr:RNA ligase family protein [Calothrix sp. FI2-JRJ7]